MNKKKQLSSFVGTFGTYEVVAPVGQGGSGIVYKARDEDGADVAVKVLRSELTSSDKRKRFKQEINFCQRNLPNVVPLKDHGVFGDSKVPDLFYVMPFYQSSLRDLMKAGLSPEKVLKYFASMLRGVEAAHRLGVIHRDLKPENILFDNLADELMVADFGIARFTEELLITAVETQDKARLANFDYHAPEQGNRARSSEVTHLADVFALGLMLNELFTGHLPRGDNYEKIVDHAPDFAWIDFVVSRMISYRPHDRPQSIEGVRLELQAGAEAASASAAAAALRAPSNEGDDYYTDDVLRDPPQLVGVDYFGDNLVLDLKPRPTRRWIKAFRAFPWKEAVAGTSPPEWNLVVYRSNPRETLSVRVPENEVQKVVDQFKRWQPLVLEHYAQELRREIEAEDRRRIEGLKQEREEEEKRARVLRSLRF